MAIHDIVSVIHVEEHEPSVSHLQLYLLSLINDKQTWNFQSVPADSATSDQVTQPAGVTVSIQLGPIIITETLLFDQAAQPGVTALFSTSAIDDIACAEESRNALPLLQHMEYTGLESDLSVSCFRPCFLAFADN